MSDSNPRQTVPIRFSGRVDQRHVQDLNTAVQAAFRAHRTLTRRLVQGFILMAVVSALMALGIWLNGKPSTKLAWFGLPEMAVLGLLVGYITLLALVRSDGQAIIRTYMRDGGWVVGDRDYVVGADGLAIEGGYGRVFCPWATFERVTEAPNTVLVWTDPGIAFLLPKDAIGDATAIERVRTHIAAAIASCR